MREKPIKNFPGYAVTENGKIISYKFKKPRILKTWLQKSTTPGTDGYENVKLSNNNKTYHVLIHRVVAEAFIPNPLNLPEVNHKNHIRTDNRVENLEWSNRIDNLYDSYKTMPPTRNFRECSLYDPGGKLIGDFQSVLAAARYGATLGCSQTGLERNKISKGYTIKYKQKV